MNDAERDRQAVMHYARHMSQFAFDALLLLQDSVGPSFASNHRAIQECQACRDAYAKFPKSRDAIDVTRAPMTYLRCDKHAQQCTPPY